MRLVRTVCPADHRRAVLTQRYGARVGQLFWQAGGATYGREFLEKLEVTEPDDP